MKYIICFKLKRRNARRKEWKRFEAENEKEAKKEFLGQVYLFGDENTKNYELVTGDWKHICFYNYDMIKELTKEEQRILDKQGIFNYK